jgi:serine/threonine protein phosphatase PrpC
MEDRCLLRQGVKVPKQQYSEGFSLFGIFDGHAGDACANFAEAELPLALLTALGGCGSGSGAQGSLLTSSSSCGWREALSSSFLSVDQKFLADPALAHTGAGCTACVVLFDGKDKLVCANLGDCRAILCGAAAASSDSGSNGGSGGGSGRASRGAAAGGGGGSFTARDLTFDCKAERADEIARIVQRGGFVNNRRVNGMLAVSRALGDGDFKRPPEPLVSACPEITETRLQPGDEFLLLACGEFVVLEWT